MKIVILVAGIGSRLGNPYPKCMTPLRPGYTILDHQADNLRAYTREIIAVVGFKKELVMEHHPEFLFVYNPRYDQTNTSQSLICALEHLVEEDLLFINGDVVFDSRIVPALLGCPDSCVAVISSRVSEEEIKFSVDAQGRIASISKIVPDPLGEAIGINLIRARDLALFKHCLKRCEDHDYFERGMEFGIAEGLVLRPVDVTEFPCIEIDFADDLKRAKSILNVES